MDRPPDLKNTLFDAEQEQQSELLALQQRLQEIQQMLEDLKQQQEDLEQQKQEMLQRWGMTELKG